MPVFNIVNIHKNVLKFAKLYCQKYLRDSNLKGHCKYPPFGWISIRVNLNFFFVKLRI